MAKAEPSEPWHAKLPTPRNQAPAAISREDLLARFNDGQVPGHNFLLVDVRRNDFEGGTIRGALNIPAQSIYHSLGTLMTLCAKAGIEEVIFWCNSSRGRGTRVAGWFDDYLDDLSVGGSVRSLILREGIKGWANAGPEYTKHMDDYDESYWTNNA